MQLYIIKLHWQKQQIEFIDFSNIHIMSSGCRLVCIIYYLKVNTYEFTQSLWVFIALYYCVAGDGGYFEVEFYAFLP
jgi:hypothetical protein